MWIKPSSDIYLSYCSIGKKKISSIFSMWFSSKYMKIALKTDAIMNTSSSFKTSVYNIKNSFTQSISCIFRYDQPLVYHGQVANQCYNLCDKIVQNIIISKHHNFSSFSPETMLQQAWSLGHTSARSCCNLGAW